METTVYPVTLTVVYIGRRLMADKKLGYAYLVLGENDIPTKKRMMFTKRAKSASGIGTILAMEQISETSFRVQGAKYLRFIDSPDIVKWRAENDAAETEYDLVKEAKGVDEWAAILRPMREAYVDASNSRQRAAILTRVMLAIQGRY